MNNILTKPYTNEQYAEFANNCNKNNQRIEIYNGDVFGLYEYEKLENSKIIDLRESQEYKARKRLEEIETQLAQLAKMQDEFLNTPVKYAVNGCHYLPRYAQETYLDLFQAEKLAQEMGLPSTFPQKIKDATKLEQNAHYMTYEELQRLSLFLIQSGYQAWSQKEQAEAALLKEKQELLEVVEK